MAVTLHAVLAASKPMAARQHRMTDRFGMLRDRFLNEPSHALTQRGGRSRIWVEPHRVRWPTFQIHGNLRSVVSTRPAEAFGFRAIATDFQSRAS